MIALIGAHSTGKTTLLQELRKHRKDIYISDGWGRPIISAGKRIGLNQKECQEIINEVSTFKWHEDCEMSNYACTRTVIDEYAYSKAFGHDEFIVDRLKVFEKGNFHNNTYFYLPIEFPLVEDGFRYAGAELQKQIDDILKNFIEYYELNVTVLSGSVQERLETMLKVLNSKK